MRTVYDPELRAHITYDDEERVRHIAHDEPQSIAPAAMEESAPGEAADIVTARDVAVAYVAQMAPLLRIPAVQLEGMSESATSIAPQEGPVQYRVSQEKTVFDATTVGFAQTVNDGSSVGLGNQRRRETWALWSRER